MSLTRGPQTLVARPGLRLEQAACRTAAPRMMRRRPVATTAAAADTVLRTMSDNGQVSVSVVVGQTLVQEACTRHGTAPTASAALGRALLGTLLLACFRGEGEKTHITFRGDGPLGSMQVIADSAGMVKGKVTNPAADPPLRPDGKLNVGAAVGRGVLAVVRSLPFTDRGWQQPYTGMTQLRSGEVAEDLAQYLAESEQTQSALALGVSLNKALEVDAAGGYLVSVLPFAEEETLAALEANISAAGSVTGMLKAGLSARDITEKLLTGLGGAADEGFTLAPRFGPCEPSGLQDRMRSAVAALGEDEVRGILEEQGQVEVTCEFCKETYQFGEEEIMGMVREMQGQAEPAGESA